MKVSRRLFFKGPGGGGEGDGLILDMKFLSLASLTARCTVPRTAMQQALHVCYCITLVFVWLSRFASEGASMLERGQGN